MLNNKDSQMKMESSFIFMQPIGHNGHRRKKQSKKWSLTGESTSSRIVNRLRKFTWRQNDEGRRTAELQFSWRIQKNRRKISCVKGIERDLKSREFIKEMKTNTETGRDQERQAKQISDNCASKKVRRSNHGEISRTNPYWME
jgi:hypothetical protein